jgi:hypothetical protein
MWSSAPPRSNPGPATSYSHCQFYMTLDYEIKQGFKRTEECFGEIYNAIKTISKKENTKFISSFYVIIF